MTAVCNLAAEYIDEPCPPSFGAVEPSIETFTDALGEPHHRFLCPIPKLPAKLSCGDNDFGAAPFADAFGWYYCENVFGLETENFDQICNDGLDNDGNGLTDCDDPACQPCEICGGNGVGCEKNCRYEVGLTVAAQWELRFRGLRMMCLRQFSQGDPNCRENSFAACNDGLDNDGNGILDCDNVLDGDRPRYADFNCCPMTVDEKNRCVVLTHDYCPGSSDDDWSDACREHALLLGCIP